jgi:histidinol-phosphatase (PHP family)
MLSNFHTHSTYCDGRSTPREIVESAISLGLSEIGFSSHSPLPGQDWCISEENLPRYFDEICSLRDEYNDKIKVFVGLEQDYMSERENLPFDYIIGSVHSVETPVGERFVDISPGGLRETVDNYFHGDVYTLAEAYYERVLDVAKKTACDIIGHFDLVTKFIDRGVPTSESHPRYIRAQDKALDRLLSTNAVFEVNTGAMARGYRSAPYPCDRVLSRIGEAGRAVVINSDSHNKSTLTFAFDEVKRRLDALSVNVVSSIEQILASTRK